RRPSSDTKKSPRSTAPIGELVDPIHWLTFCPPVVPSARASNPSVLVRSARCSSSNSLVRFESAHRVNDVSTKVPTRKRFHENLFVGSELKALSSRFCAHTHGKRAPLRRARATTAAPT